MLFSWGTYTGIASSSLAITDSVIESVLSVTVSNGSSLSASLIPNPPDGCNQIMVSNGNQTKRTRDITDASL